MKRSHPILFLFSVLLLTSLACQSLQGLSQPEVIPTSTFSALVTTAPNSIPLTEADVPRISAEDAKIALDAGEAIIVDVRNAEAYANSHAAGAIHIPLDDFEINIANIPLATDEWIITYCT